MNRGLAGARRVKLCCVLCPVAHRDPVSRFSSPPQKSAAAADSSRAGSGLKAQICALRRPAKPAQQAAKNPNRRSRQQKIPVGMPAGRNAPVSAPVVSPRSRFQYDLGGDPVPPKGLSSSWLRPRVAELPRMPAGSAAQQRRRRHPPACWLAGGASGAGKGGPREGGLHAKCSREALCGGTL